MNIIPAIDIHNGNCVRLTQGDFVTQKIYSDDPTAKAKSFVDDGADMLHIVDLDGARDGKPKNMKTIIRIRNSLTTPIQVGGGIRTMDTARAYFDIGINRIVIGTKAITDSDFLQRLLHIFGSERIVVGLDLRDDMIATEGWKTTTTLSYKECAKELKKFGIQYIVCTDIFRDGTLTEPNFEQLNTLQKMGFDVIASGGISDEKTIDKLNMAGMSGAIVGKALYEGKLSLRNITTKKNGISRLTKRIIPCLDIKNGRVVKGINFKNLRDSGDPVERAKVYEKQGADELVFLDITASKEKRNIITNMVREVAKEIFIPFTVGGGIRNVKDIRAVLSAGADKVSINSAAVQNPAFINKAVSLFGSQCIVVAIDTKIINGKNTVFINGGTTKTNLDTILWAYEIANRGAGEILLTSMDKDGTEQGFDTSVLADVAFAVHIPIIASGGAGSLFDIKEAFTLGRADAVLVASIFHNNTLSVKDVKKYLTQQNIPIRL